MAIPDYEKMMAERMANGVIDFLPVTSATTSPNATTTTQPPKGKSNNRKRPASAASNNGGGEKNPKPVKVARTEHHPLPAESLSVTAAAAAGGGGGDGIIAPLPRSAAGYDNWTDPLWVADSESLDSSPAEGTGTKKEIEPPNPGDLNYFIF